MKEFVEKLIERLEESRKYNEKMLSDSNDCFSRTIYESQMNTYENSIRIVNQLAEEYNQGWIPITERLPEEESNVIITTKAGNVMMGMYTKRYGFGMKKGFICADCFRYLESVTAWQPLPEPYKPKEQQEEV